jgi:hypothetical protein
MSKAKTTSKSKSRGRTRAKKATTGARRTRKAAKQTDVRARRGSGSQAAEGRDGGRPEQLLDE